MTTEDRTVMHLTEFSVLRPDNSMEVTGVILLPDDYDGSSKGVVMPLPDVMDRAVGEWLDSHDEDEFQFRPSDIVRDLYGEDVLQWVDEDGDQHYVAAVQESLIRLAEQGRGTILRRAEQPR